MSLTLQQMVDQQTQEQWRIADQARQGRDTMQMLGIAARQVRLPMDEIVDRYNSRLDGVVVESDASKTGYALADEGNGRSLLAMIDRELDVRRVDRAFRVSRSRMSDLDAPRAVRDLDVKVQDTIMAETMEHIEQEVLPARVLGWVAERNTAPALRKSIAAGLRARDEKFLEQVLITTRYEPGPSGRLVQIDEVAMWDRVANPRLLGETLVQRYGPGARQMNMLEVLKVERTRALLEARGYPVEASTIGRIESVGLNTVDGAA